jgi:hypothetical protein
LLAHPVVEDPAAAAQHLHQPRVQLPHHGVARHHYVNALAQQFVDNLTKEDAKPVNSMYTASDTQ